MGDSCTITRRVDLRSSIRVLNLVSGVQCSEYARECTLLPFGATYNLDPLSRPETLMMDVIEGCSCPQDCRSL